MPTKKSKASTPPDYTNNVFINCPFDEQYNDIFEAIVFTIVDCGFIPRCALEAHDSDDIRIEKIMRIIDECKYGIHDISRTDIDSNTQLPRFNMPLELGIFMGCKKFGTGKSRDKAYLILDLERYRYRNFLSDIGGQDIKAHNNDPQKAIRHTRDWLSDKTNRTTIPTGKIIWTRFEEFNGEFPDICSNMNWDPDELTFTNRCTVIKKWLEKKAPHG